jgi:hypothetical protein
MSQQANAMRKGDLIRGWGYCELYVDNEEMMIPVDPKDRIFVSDKDLMIYMGPVFGSSFLVRVYHPVHGPRRAHRDGIALCVAANNT